MGIQRTLRKKKTPMALADCHMGINGCQVLLGHVNPKHVTQVAKEFKVQLGNLVKRASRPTYEDIVFKSLERLN